MSSYLSYIIIVVLWSFSVTRWVDYFSIFGYYTNETLPNCNFCQNRFKILRNTKKTFEKLPQTIRNLCQNGKFRQIWSNCVLFTLRQHVCCLLIVISSEIQEHFVVRNMLCLLALKEICHSSLAAAKMCIFTHPPWYFAKQ